MEKLIELLNQYEDSRWESVYIEDEDWIDYEEKPTRREVDWHIWHCNASTVAFEKDTFDSYALSKQYGFVIWLLNHWKLGTDFLAPMLKMNKRYHLGTHDTILMYLATKNNPIDALISMLK